jgi:hypothetical protein
MSTALLRDADISASLTFELPQRRLSPRWRRRQRRQSAHVPIVMVLDAAFVKGPNVQSVDPLDENGADTNIIRKRYYMSYCRSTYARRLLAHRLTQHEAWTRLGCAI